MIFHHLTNTEHHYLTNNKHHDDLTPSSPGYIIARNNPPPRHQAKHSHLPSACIAPSSVIVVMLLWSQSLHAVAPPTLIHFLPTLFSQLVRLVARTGSAEVAENAIKVMIHVVTAVTAANRTQLLHTYVKVRGGGEGGKGWNIVGGGWRDWKCVCW